MANATIASGASLSDALDTGLVHSMQKFVGVIMPNAWTTANLTFQGSDNNSTFSDIYDDNGTELTITAAASRAIGFRGEQQQVLSTFRFLKVRSGTSGTPVSQGAERILGLLYK